MANGINNEDSTITNDSVPVQILRIGVLGSRIDERIVKVYKKGVSKADIRVSELEFGIYTIVVLTDTGTVVKKLIVNR